MGNFCKGALIGMIAGVCVGAIVIAKNKKLSNKLNEGLTTAEGKLKEVKENLDEKLNNDCGCGNDNCDIIADNCDCGEENCNCNNDKNNFSKKAKNY